MKLSRWKSPNFALLATIAALCAVSCTAEAEVYVSNVGVPWTDPGSIGDIHALFPGGDPYTAHFQTGSGAGFSVNSITLEFNSVDPLAWQNVQVQLFEQAGTRFLPTNTVLLGSFGNPVVNPETTRWPGNTTYIDFFALGSIQLNPLIGYGLAVSVPSSSPTSVALLFNHSQTFYSPTDWKMTRSTLRQGFPVTQFMVLAVDATPVPEPSVGASLICGFVLWGVRLFRRGLVRK